MKVFITGGAGFLGTHTSRLLLEQGHQVTIYDSLVTSSQDSVDPRANFIQGDICDQELLEKSLVGHDAVIHMASLIQVNESVSKPIEYSENNILGSIHLVEAMRKVGLTKIIFSSSATVYGFPKTVPVTEESPVLAANPYGMTKVAIENLLHCYHYIHKFDVCLLRYFNPYGPDKHYDSKSNLMPNLIKKALKKEKVPVYWKGEQIRDYIYVEDLAQAHIDVLELAGWNIFNVGTGKGVTVVEIINSLSEILGYPLEMEDLGERAGDVHSLYASSELLQSKTKWRPRYDLQNGLKKTVQWFQENIK